MVRWDHEHAAQERSRTTSEETEQRGRRSHWRSTRRQRRTPERITQISETVRANIRELIQQLFDMWASTHAPLAAEEIERTLPIIMFDNADDVVNRLLGRQRTVEITEIPDRFLISWRTRAKTAMRHPVTPKRNSPGDILTHQNVDCQETSCRTREKTVMRHHVASERRPPGDILSPQNENHQEISGHIRTDSARKHPVAPERRPS
ncbi:hypothetical protein R1sor_021989 [Riccia sorocarpa]|uniref:Uncharacterized protein n=1 Tax=Riccia sorocarpa TaxID=122646 RepID=A0ABD3GIL1_9MARC